MLIIISYDEVSGRKMYLIECLGGAFFWAPSRVHAHAVETEEFAKKLAVNHLPADISEEAIEIVSSGLFYVEVPPNMDEERRS